MLLTAGLTSAACSSPPEPVVMGVTGEWSRPHTESLRLGMEMAGDAVNREGGIGGRPLRLRFVDVPSSDTEEAVSAARRLADDPSVVAVAAGGGSLAVASAFQVHRNRLPMVAAVSTVPGLEGAWAWNLNLSPAELAAAAESALEAMGPGPVALLFDNTPGGRTLATALRPELPRRPAVVQPLYTEEVTGDFRPIVEALSLHGVERVVLATASRNGRVLLPLLRELRPGTGIVAFDQILPLLGSGALEGARIVLPRYVDPRGRLRDTAFARAVESRTGRTPDGMTALGYDAIRLLARAAREGGPDRDAIRRWLSSLDRDEAYHGVTGPAWFDAGGRRGLDAVVGRVCRNGDVAVDGACP